MDGWIPRNAREMTGMVYNTIESANAWLNSAEGKGHWGFGRSGAEWLSRAVATDVMGVRDAERP